VQQAIAAQRSFRAGGLAALGGSAAKIKNVGLEGGHPLGITLQVFTFGREAS
jgi:hypothetical protein